MAERPAFGIRFAPKACRSFPAVSRIDTTALSGNRKKSPGIPYRAADLCRFRLLQYSALTGGIHHNEFRGPLDRLAIRTQLRIDPDLEDRG